MSSHVITYVSGLYIYTGGRSAALVRKTRVYAAHRDQRRTASSRREGTGIVVV